jgi:hypothetical protein
MTNAPESIEFTRIDNDANGNPRYVCHFLYLNTDAERNPCVGDTGYKPLQHLYAAACKRANSIGGRKYHTKRFGGGIVFQSYALAELVRHIAEATGRNFTGYTCN